MSKQEIKLSFHRDAPRQYPTGYWYAEASFDNSPDYDGVGATPLDAMTELAEQMYAKYLRDKWRENVRTQSED